MTGFAALTKIQSKVFGREPISVFFGLVFPALILVMIGLVFPGSTNPEPDLGGRSLVEIYAPTSIALGLTTVAFTILPGTLGGDREKGILRRLSTTPARSGMLMAAHLVVQLVVVTIAASAAVVLGMLVFGLPFPESFGWFLASFLLGAICLLGVGLLIGSLVPTASSGQAVGMLVFFPLLFFAGVYVPLELMPEGLRTVSSYTPSGAAVQALSASWEGGVPEASSLIAMAACALVAVSFATWRFRWE